MPILIYGMEALLLRPTLLHRSKTKEALMPNHLFKLFDRVALGFFTALAMVPVLTVALGGVFH